MSNTCDETKCNGDCSSCGGDGVTVTLTLDDDSTVECAIVGIFDAGEKEYIALLPLEDETVLIYEYNEKEDGDVELGLIEDDDVFEKVSNTFYEIWDDEEDDEEE